MAARVQAVFVEPEEEVHAGVRGEVASEAGIALSREGGEIELQMRERCHREDVRSLAARFCRDQRRTIGKALQTRATATSVASPITRASVDAERTSIPASDTRETHRLSIESPDSPSVECP